MSYIRELLLCLLRYTISPTGGFWLQTNKMFNAVIADTMKLYSPKAEASDADHHRSIINSSSFKLLVFLVPVTSACTMLSTARTTTHICEHLGYRRLHHLGSVVCLVIGYAWYVVEVLAASITKGSVLSALIFKELRLIHLQTALRQTRCFAGRLHPHGEQCCDRGKITWNITTNKMDTCSCTQCMFPHATHVWKHPLP